MYVYKHKQIFTYIDAYIYVYMFIHNIYRLVLPYLDRCVTHATILNQRAEAYSDMLEGDVIAEMALHNPQLVKVRTYVRTHVFVLICMCLCRYTCIYICIHALVCIYECIC
jgi:hypothetical protein